MIAIAHFIAVTLYLGAAAIAARSTTSRPGRNRYRPVVARCARSAAAASTGGQITPPIMGAAAKIVDDDGGEVVGAQRQPGLHAGLQEAQPLGVVDEWRRRRTELGQQARQRVPYPGREPVDDGRVAVVQRLSQRMPLRALVCDATLPPPPASVSLPSAQRYSSWCFQ